MNAQNALERIEQEQEKLERELAIKRKAAEYIESLDDDEAEDIDLNEIYRSISRRKEHAMKWFVVVWKTYNQNHAAAVRIPVFKDTKPKEEAIKIICAKFGYLKKPSSMLATEAPFEYVQRHGFSCNTYF